jgi:hypothetical protein
MTRTTRLERSSNCASFAPLGSAGEERAPLRDPLQPSHRATTIAKPITA